MTTARQWIARTARRLDEAGVCFGHGTDNCHDEAAWLVAHAVGIDVQGLFDGADYEVGSAEAHAIKALLENRIEQRVPLAYLTGEAWFCGLSFEVTPEVLIPRSPISELIQDGFHPWVDSARVESMLDLCTGSGCIGIACAKQFPRANVTASDISTRALNVARRNCRRHDVQDRVRLVESDLYSSLGEQKYDVIVSNPPYVSAAQLEMLPPEYQAEPQVALRSDMRGAEIPLRILAGAAESLSEGGVLVCEVGETQQVITEILPDVEFLWLEFANGGEGVFLLEGPQIEYAAGEAKRALEQMNVS